MDHVENETADLIASQLNGRLTRRQLATGVLAIPALSALIAACGSDSKSTTAGTGATGTTVAGGATETSAATGSSVAATAGGNMIIAMDLPGGPFDPVAMYDLVAYGLVAQCFEFLCSLGDNADIGPGLATEWSSNADATEWTFKLRDGVTWQSGEPFTAADVAATMDRLVEGGNSGLSGILSKGSVTAPDPLTAVIKLDKPVGLFPYLVSVYNAQTVITPVNYPLGNTLDKNPEGTGPWILDSLDPTTSAKFRRNPAYWGGAPLLDTIEFQFFPDTDTQVTALQGGNVDVVLQFQASTGNSLFTDSNINVTTLPRRNPSPTLDALRHRPVRRQEGSPSAGSDARPPGADLDAVRRQGRPGQRPRHRPDLPVLRRHSARSGSETSTRPSRCSKMPDSPTGSTATLYAGNLQEIKQLAQLVAVQAADAGFKLTRERRRQWRVLRRVLVPGRPGRPALLGCRRDRDRRLRPPRHARRVPQRGAQDPRHLELVAVLVADARRRVRGLPSGARDRRRRSGSRRQEHPDDPQRRHRRHHPVLLQLPQRLVDEGVRGEDERTRPDLPGEGSQGLTGGGAGPLIRSALPPVQTLDLLRSCFATS